ncbi:flavin-containing monooxygenase [Herbiconiux daphne]|uniref:NAD(P)/FAD-dependent oxidoreductase n=1 Tax=Herbiconiux daphne TaxID=2970914 RepID=A0ABT2H3J9_9MICO|nr:NAD(P)/FAD-dependent oxidoreductase [Herbiconiux daphne]MCS5734507.1 NAD(P)/FAD-dependent oxidoreductase [Herbiconiux daphne]
MTDSNVRAVEVADFDPLELKRKYAQERAKRIRDDGIAQYRQLTGPFAELADDPYVEPGFEREPLQDEVDVVVVGGGFGGLLSAAELRRAGVEKIRIIERGGDIGGTWYWNRYPGAACDIESYIYLPMLEEVGGMPKNKYARAPEIWEHTKKIARTFDLYRDALFQTKITDARWNDETEKRTIRTSRDDVITARYLVTSTGPLAHPKLPRIPGIESYEGHMFHTSRWDYGYTGGDNEGGLTGLADKRVAIIGTGATAIQCVPHLGAGAKELFVVQRTPSSVHVRADRPTDADWFRNQPKGWQRERMANFTTVFHGGRVEEDLVHDAWTESFFDATDIAAQGIVSPFQMSNFLKMEDVRARVDSIVDDPATAESLKPWYNFFCKRPCFHDQYLATFNRANVHLVDTDGQGVERIDETGLWVNGEHYEVDCIIFSTGFEVGTGFAAKNGFAVRGRGGVTLDEHWADGFRSLHGIHVNGFPNYFYVGGLEQAGRTANFAHMISEQAAYLGYVFEAGSGGATRTIEVTAEAEQAWVTEIVELVTKNSAAAQNQAFQQECTPGYYNNEGAPSRIAIQNGAYGGGPMAYVEVLNSWREEGGLAGLSITEAP